MSTPVLSESKGGILGFRIRNTKTAWPRLKKAVETDTKLIHASLTFSFACKLIF